MLIKLLFKMIACLESIEKGSSGFVDRCTENIEALKKINEI